MSKPSIFKAYRPKRDLLHLYCGCCGAILNAHTPKRCPNCRQPVDLDGDDSRSPFPIDDGETKE